MDKKYIEYIAFTAYDIINEKGTASIDDVIKQHNKKWEVNVGEEDMDEVISTLLSDYKLSDYEIVDNITRKARVFHTIQPKVYEPFTCFFETTGRVVIENDLRRFFGKQDFNINSTKGIIETMDYYAKQKMLHGFVGNSCPGIYLNISGVIHIGCESEVEPEEDEVVDILPSGFEHIASVCTDLWWYSIIDLEELKKLDKNFDEKNYTIVDIPAGTWRLSHKYGISERGYHENLPYATLELMK